jgi:hypothetical protein
VQVPAAVSSGQAPIIILFIQSAQRLARLDGVAGRRTRRGSGSGRCRRAIGPDAHAGAGLRRPGFAYAGLE